MDQALASPVASYARNPAAPRTSSFWLPSEGQSQTVAPPRDGSAPRSGPHSEPVHIAPRPSSPALCQSRHKGLSAGFLLRLRYRNIRPLTEGLLLRRFHDRRWPATCAARVRYRRPSSSGIRFAGTGRAVQRSIVSPFSNGIEEFEGQRRTKDSLGRKSLNLCEATESFGGCLEVIRTFPLAARNNPRSAARRRQTLPTAACPAVFHFRDCERCQLVSRHPHLHQGPSATAEQSL